MRSLRVAVRLSEQKDLRLGILFSLVVVSVHLFNWPTFLFAWSMPDEISIKSHDEAH